MKYLKSILFILVLVIFDQITKLYFLGKDIFISDFFSFKFVANTGTSFGLLKNNNLIFIFGMLFVMVFILYYYDKYKSYSLAFNFILAGSFGNLIDRIFRGYVVDFIYFKFWYVFNLADLFITIGSLILIYYFFKEKD